MNSSNLAASRRGFEGFQIALTDCVILSDCSGNRTEVKTHCFRQFSVMAKIGFSTYTGRPNSSFGRSVDGAPWFINLERYISTLARTSSWPSLEWVMRKRKNNIRTMTYTGLGSLFSHASANGYSLWLVHGTIYAIIQKGRIDLIPWLGTKFKWKGAWLFVKVYRLPDNTCLRSELIMIVHFFSRSV